MKSLVCKKCQASFVSENKEQKDNELCNECLKTKTVTTNKLQETYINQKHCNRPFPYNRK